MFVMMGISLYTSRVLLQTLGVDDFGTYNVVGGVVVFFSIFNGALSSSTQRFLNFEMGRGNANEVISVFKCSMTLHLLLICAVFLLAETLGLWYLNNLMNVPEGRISAANWVYQFSVIAFLLNIFRVPFNAAIVAHEKMDFYAYMSIVEAVLKLCIVFLISFFDYDKLVFYGLLLMIANVIVNQSYIFYSICKFKDIRFGFEWNKVRLSKMVSFSGWSLLGSSAVVCNQHGVNLILNYFCGVAINAAAGIAGQVTSAMYGFISNFQVAFNPQIVKLYAQKDEKNFFGLVFNASKFSFLLFWMISLPVLYSVNTILVLWLGHVPDHTAFFCRIIIIYLLVDALNGPLWTSANASGKIRGYQILMSSILIINIPVVYLLLMLGYAPETAWLSKLIFNVIAMVARLLYLKKIIGFSIIEYLKKVLYPITIVAVISLIPSTIMGEAQTFLHLIAQTMLDVMVVVVCSYFIAFSKEERTKCVVLLKKRFNK